MRVLRGVYNLEGGRNPRRVQHAPCLIGSAPARLGADLRCYPFHRSPSGGLGLGFVITDTPHRLVRCRFVLGSIQKGGIPCRFCVPSAPQVITEGRRTFPLFSVLGTGARSPPAGIFIFDLSSFALVSFPLLSVSPFVLWFISFPFVSSLLPLRSLVRRKPGIQPFWGCEVNGLIIRQCHAIL